MHIYYILYTIVYAVRGASTSSSFLFSLRLICNPFLFNWESGKRYVEPRKKRIVNGNNRIINIVRSHLNVEVPCFITRMVTYDTFSEFLFCHSYINNIFYYSNLCELYILIVTSWQWTNIVIYIWYKWTAIEIQFIWEKVY